MNSTVSEVGDGANSSVGKKRKMSTNSNSATEGVFKDFKLTRVLREDDRHKMICMHGTLPAKETKATDKETDTNTVSSVDSDVEKVQDAVIVLERKPFDSTTVEECLQQTCAHETLQNDIYSTYDMFSVSKKPDMKATVICPATEKHIAKYSVHEPFIVHETPELYNSVTLPCIQASKFSIQWVYNILEKKQESDRIVVEDPDPETGFIMVPDMKWDRQKVDSLYLVAIVHKHGLKSIRDLTAEHLPLLRNVLDKGLSAIHQQFGVGPDKLRVYFHYQPSYYHLHIHFTHIQFDAPGSDVMRAHLINDVIDNISLDGDFYSKKTLSYVVRQGDNLHTWYTDKGYFNQ